jgi:hypothetical protein
MRLDVRRREERRKDEKEKDGDRNFRLHPLNRSRPFLVI